MVLSLEKVRCFVNGTQSGYLVMQVSLPCVHVTTVRVYVTISKDTHLNYRVWLYLARQDSRDGWNFGDHVRVLVVRWYAVIHVDCYGPRWKLRLLMPFSDHVLKSPSDSSCCVSERHPVHVRIDLSAQSYVMFYMEVYPYLVHRGTTEDESLKTWDVFLPAGVV